MGRFVASNVDARLLIEFGTAILDSHLPVLGGDARERLFGPVPEFGRIGDFRLFRSDCILLGAAQVAVSAESLERTTHTLYRELLGATRGWHLARIWNYVPDINSRAPCGLENYRTFCRGRSNAFEQELGAGFTCFLPAASAVGCPSGRLTLAFVATRTPAVHFENPLQVPAYRYPENYGPRPPSFARATVVPRAGQEPAVFVSGTAAIRGHVTLAPSSTVAQLGYTLENLRMIGTACGAGEDLEAGRRTRHFKVYLRHAEDHPAVADTLDRELLGPRDEVSYVRADLCREPLKIEIEATLI